MAPNEEQASDYTGLIAHWTLVLYFAFSLLLAETLNPALLVVATVTFVLGSNFLHILLHEAGHAISARLLGMDVFKFSVGTGRTWWSGMMGDCWIELHLIPAGGYVLMGLRSPQFGRLKEFLAVLAGPMVDLIWALAGFVLLVNPDNDWLRIAGLSLLLGGISALWDSGWYKNVLVEGLMAEPDLRRLASISRLSPAEVEQGVVGSQFTKASLEAQREVQQSGELWWHRFVELCPIDTAVSVYRHSIQALAEDSATARRAELLDSFCTYILMLGDETLFAEGDALSRELYASDPNQWTLCGTRGSFLVLCGPVEEGCRMLEEVFANSDSPTDQSISASFLALGAAWQGDAASSAKWLELARERGHGTVPIPWVEARIAGTLTSRRTEVQATVNSPPRIPTPPAHNGEGRRG